MDERDAKIVISADTSNYTSSVNESYEATNRLNTALGQTQKSMDNIVARAGKKLALFGAADLTALSSAVTVAATLDKQMSTLNATAVNLGKSSSKTFKTDIRDGIRAISRELPVARGEVVQLATAITKMGQTSSTTITTLTKSFLQLGAATGESPTALAQSQLGLSRTMGTFIGAPGTNGAQIIKNFNDSTTSLSAQGGVSAQSILDFSQMLAPTARMANISQTDLLGVSTAFTRSGADGQYAANTFNQLVNDLTEQRVTGDPRLRIFQTQLGLTDKQMKKADPVEIFSKLAETVNQQGDRGVVTLDALNLGGIRNKRAIQSVAAEGNVNKWVDIAREEYGSGSTEKGAKEAFGGLFDSLEKIKNNFTDLAQVIGQSLLPAVDKTVAAFAKAFEVVSKIAQPILKALGPVMTGGGGAALAGAAMLGIWSKMGPIAMARWGMKTRPGEGLLEGFRMGKTVNMEGVDALTPHQQQYAADVANKNVGAWSRGAYRVGGMWGGLRGLLANQTGGQGGILREMAAGGSALTKWLAGQTAMFYDQSTARSGYDKLRSDGGRRGFWSSFRDARKDGLMGTIAGQSDEATRVAGRAPVPTLKEIYRSQADNLRAQSTFRGMVTAAGQSAAALGRVGLAANKAAMSLLGSGAGLATRGIGKGMKALGGGLLDLAGGWTGIGLMAAGATAYVGKSLYDGSRRQEVDLRANEEISQGLNAYNEKLGLANDSLTTFRSALDAASGALSKNLTYASVAKDKSLAAEGAKQDGYTDQFAGNVKSNFTALNWLKAEGEIGPERFQEIAKDLYKRQSEGANIDVQQVLRTYNGWRQRNKKSGAIDVGNGGEILDVAMQNAQWEGGLVDQAKRNLYGPMAVNVGEGMRWLGRTLTGIMPGLGVPLTMLAPDAKNTDAGRRYAMNLWDTPGVQQATQKEVDRTRTLQDKLQDKYGGTEKGARASNDLVVGDAYATMVKFISKGTPEGLKAAQMYADGLRQTGEFEGSENVDLGTMDFAGKTSKEIAKMLVDKKVIGTIDLNKVRPFAESNIGDIGNQKYSPATKAFRNNEDYAGIAGFKQYAAETGESKLLANAELRSSDPNLQWRAVQKQREAARKAAKGNLYQTDVLYDTTIAQYVEGPRADAARAAQELDSQERAYQSQFTNRPAQVGSTISEWQATMRSPDSMQGIGQKRFAAAEKAKQSIADLYMTMQQYDRQMEREEEDFYQNRAWSMEDFYRSRRQSTDAYHRQMEYSEQEFNIQRKRSDDEYHRSVRRSTADHYRELLREEKSYEMQRKWSVGDYNRSKARSDQDYQRQVRLQWRDFNISMKRAEEDYAKQKARAEFDFNLSRKRAFRDFGISLKRSQEDYQRQLQYGEEDYQKSRMRATEDFNLSLSRSYEDYNKSRVREEEDHFIQLARMSKDAAKQFYDPWLRVQSQATAGTDTFLENLRDQGERIERQFANLKKLRSRGLSQDSIDMFGLADPNKAQQLQRLTVEMTDKQIAEINRLTKAREKGAKQLTQSDFNEQFRRMEEDREKSLKRGEEDFRLSVERSIADFQKSMKRMAEDYNTSLLRSAEQFNLAQRRSVEDFERSMTDSAEDFKRSMERGDEDFALSMKRAKEDFLRSLEDSAYSYRLSMERSDEDFERSLKRQDKLRKISLNQAAKDWERMLNRQAKDYARSVRNMIKDHDRAVDHSNKEFQISMHIANENFKRQLERADISREKMLKRSKQDLIGYGKSTFSSYGAIIKNLSGLLDKHMGSSANGLINKMDKVQDKLFNWGKSTGKVVKDAFTKQVDEIIKEMQRAVGKAAAMADALAVKLRLANKAHGSATTSNQQGWYFPGQGTPGVVPPPGKALGGVATGDSVARVGEGGPELILPLNSRGMDYLTTALRQYAQTDAMRLKSTQSGFYQQSSGQGNLTQFNFGDVSVASDTPDQFYKEMKQKESLKKLVGH